MNKLSIKNLSISLEDDFSNHVEVLKDISIEVKDKEFVAIVGPSGAGKTTLLRIVAGLLKPSSGKVFLDKEEIHELTPKIGMVFQNPTSFPWLTVKENVEFGPKLQKISEEKIKKLSQFFINSVGLAGYENAFLSILSGGMKQRVAIAAVLANEPEILLMDEPFSNLDTQTKGLMQELIMSIWEETKKTVLFVTHDIEESIFLADKVYVLGTRPGFIKTEIDITLPRPRTQEMKLSEEFLQIKKHISYLIRGEAIKSAQVPIKTIRPKALKIGLHIWPGISPFFLAQERGLYNEKILEVELMNLEKETDRFEALSTDQVDLLTLTLDAAILAKEKIKDLKIITLLNKSLGGDALIANKDINSIPRLRGKNIALEENWVSHYFLSYILDQNKMSIKDIQIVNMKGSDIGAALISKKVDAAILWEPWLSQTKRLTDANILASTNEYPVIFDVLVGKEKNLFERSDDIGKLIKIWFESVDFFEKNKKEACKITSFFFGLSNVELENYLSKLDFFDESNNSVFFGTQKAPGKLLDLIKTANKIWVNESKMTEIINYQEIVNPLFL